MADVARLGLAGLEVGAIGLLALVRVAGPLQGEGGRALHADDAVSRLRWVRAAAQPRPQARWVLLVCGAAG